LHGPAPFYDPDDYGDASYVRVTRAEALAGKSGRTGSIFLPGMGTRFSVSTVTGQPEKTGLTARNRPHIFRLNREKPDLFNRNRPEKSCIKIFYANIKPKFLRRIYLRQITILRQKTFFTAIFCANIFYAKIVLPKFFLRQNCFTPKNIFTAIFCANIFYA